MPRLIEVDGRHPCWPSPGEPLQEPGEEHATHGGAERRRHAAAPAGAEGDEPQVVLGERDLQGRRDVAVGVEAERHVPDGRVAAEAHAAEEDVAALGHAVPGDGRLDECDVGDIERRDGVQAERLADAGPEVVEPRDVRLLNQPAVTAHDAVDLHHRLPQKLWVAHQLSSFTVSLTILTSFSCPSRSRPSSQGM
jgi:hypothetical protein